MRWPVLVAGGLAAVTLCGCFDGTVRDPREAGAGGTQGKGARAAREAAGRRRTRGRGGGGATVSFAAVGDTGMGIAPLLPPEPATYLEPISGELQGDVVFGNLEGTLSDVTEDVKCGDAEPGTCFAFRVPPEYAEYFAGAGFTVMNLANNHSFDFGETGQRETIEALRGAGIAPTGLPAEAAEVKVDGHLVAFLGFAPYAYTNSLTDLESAAALIAPPPDPPTSSSSRSTPAPRAPTRPTRPTPRRPTWARTAATRSSSPTWRSAPAPTWSSAPARTCCAGWRSTAAA